MFSRPSPTFLATFAASVAALLLFLAVNGGLIFFFDSRGYHLGAEVLINHWRGEDMTGGASFIGRSIYYGLLMQWELAHAPFAPVQILSVAWMLSIAHELILGDRRPLAGAVIAAALCLLTPVPFFTVNVMPDVYAGLSILGTALFLVYGERMRRAQRAGLIFVMILAALFHQTHLVLIAGFVVIAALGFGVATLARLALARAFAARLIPLFIVILAGIGGEAAFRIGMEAVQGEPPIRRPFILARLIADGPGYRYLKNHCPAEGWVMCDNMQNLPVNMDWFLWSYDPDKSVYTNLDRAGRRALEREEFDLVARIITAEPGGVLAAAGHNWRRQLDMFTVEDFFYTHAMGAGIDRYFAPYVDSVQGQRIVTSEAVLGSFSALHRWLVYAAFAGIAFLATRQKRAGQAETEDERNMHLFAALLICGLLMNGAVCGMLSEPHHRYQARVIWLLPYAAILYGALWWRWRQGEVTA